MKVSFIVSAVLPAFKLDREIAEVPYNIGCHVCQRSVNIKKPLQIRKLRNIIISAEPHALQYMNHCYTKLPPNVPQIYHNCTGLCVNLVVSFANFLFLDLLPSTNLDK